MTFRESFNSFFNKHKRIIVPIIFAFILFAIFNPGEDIELVSETASIFGTFTGFGLTISILMIIAGVVLLFMGQILIGGTLITAGIALTKGIKLLIIADIFKIVGENPILLIGVGFVALLLMLKILKK